MARLALKSKFNIYFYFTHRENYDSHKLSHTMPAAKKDTAIFSIGLTDDAVLLAACLTEMKYGERITMRIRMKMRKRIRISMRNMRSEYG